ncbi:MAG: LolA family protein [Desulfuromonadales bacterium]
MKNPSFFSALFLGISLAFAAAPVWAVSLSEVISTLEIPFQTETDKALRINNYSADFSQESKIASLDRLQRANGRIEVAFDYQREKRVPDVKFRWQYAQPTTQEIVSDGKTLWVYLPENNQVIQSDLAVVNQDPQNDPMTFLTGLGNLSRDFQISWGTPNNDISGNYILELTPRKASSLINRLVIVVDSHAVEAYQKRSHEGGKKEPWYPIISSAVHDPNGNSTVIEFSKLQVNPGVPETSFNFIMPAGVQVVRPTDKEMGF